MVLTLTPETEARLRDRASREGQDVSEYAEAVLSDFLSEDPDDLSPEQLAESVRAIQRGLDALERGEERSLEAYVAEVMARRAAR